MTKPDPGTYALILTLPSLHTLTIGKLGTFCFPAGHYLYTGSALGPGGLAARLARHCRIDKKKHWHIDYLRSVGRLEQVWSWIGAEPAECQWAAAALRLPGAKIPAPRFGASDCRCPAHLFHYPQRPDPRAFAQAVSPGGLAPASRQIRATECPGIKAVAIISGSADNLG